MFEMMLLGMKHGPQLDRRWAETPNATAGLYPATALVMWGYGGKIYVTGGEGPKPAGINNAILRVFDPATQEWTATTSNWFSRKGAACAVLNDKAYVIGGIDVSISNVVSRYDLISEVWAPVATYPISASGQTAITVGNNIYVFGGNLGSANSKAAYSYSDTNNRWTKLADMPEGVYSGQAFALNNPDIIYYAGGLTTAPVNKIWRYTISTNQWAQTVVTLPAPLFSMSICPVGDELYMFGGNSGGTKINNDIYSINKATLSFTLLLENVPKARYGHSATTIGNDMYVYGGFNSGYLSDMWLRR